MPGGWSRLRASFQRIIADARNWGLSIVQGIWTGIQNGWTWLLNLIKTNINNLLIWVKNLLGISSPSKVFAEYGNQMAQGIGAGFIVGMKSVNPMIDAALLRPAPAYATNGNAGRGGGDISGTFQFYSSLTMEERRRIRRDSQKITQRELLKALR